ncbi:MAG: calcium-binding protein, partial [Thermoplasmata archaeon]
LLDGEELKIYGTDPNKTDTDADMLSDYEEIFKYFTNATVTDTDGDGLSDGEEILITNTDPWSPDSDADGLKDSVEYTLGLNPLSNDTDTDQWLDAQEFQYWKSKGLSDTKAAEYCKTPDVDGDSITDYQEVFGYNVKIIT